MAKPFLLCIGHRGAMGHEPENTLRSLRKALALGAKCVEIDVYHVDGRLVVIHDDRLERTTNGAGFVMDQSFAYLRSLDAGLGERIPTLEEVCGLVDGKAGLNIELKGPGTSLPTALVVARLAQAGFDRDAFLVSSFNHRELELMRQADPGIRLGVLAGTHLEQGLGLAERLGAFSVHLPMEAVNRAGVGQAHDNGLMVYAYTVNRASDLARMHAYGVDGVFTNYPERVLERYGQGDGSAWWPGRDDRT